MDVQEIPYFAYNTTHDICNIKRISLNSDNIDEMLQILEDEGNLFDVIPSLQYRVRKEHPIKQCSFERRNEVDIEGEKFVSDNGYHQVGKLIVPYYETLSREEMESKKNLITIDLTDKELYINALTTFPDTKTFIMDKILEYIPIDSNKILVLNKYQL
ncbi:hypothetical protein CL615_02770 [archaeon]|jgi:hypothetical protein|nr:hypothetical protein [archaeon]MDP6548206.1 hypothetical protein [Candidatus Woesearchaeota archaeon]|tara:strand:+ start:4829 stop:5302 length:474 start_codon:yes stop_codon:yes gene_type:complete